jgi:hypothetical protein
VLDLEVLGGSLNRPLAYPSSPGELFQADGVVPVVVSQSLGEKLNRPVLLAAARARAEEVVAVDVVRILDKDHARGLDLLARQVIDSVREDDLLDAVALDRCQPRAVGLPLRDETVALGLVGVFGDEDD